MNKEQKNSQAYDDVLEGNGSTMPSDPEYMEAYRFWYPLGHEAQESSRWDESCWTAGDFA